MNSFNFAIVLVLGGSVAASDWSAVCVHPLRTVGDREPTIVHIPKTAGSSFTADGQKILSQEHCLMKMYQPGRYMMSFFREPRAHVYSQFAQVVFAKMCTKTKLKPGDLMHVEFAKWVGYFYKGLQPNGSMTVTDSLGCYHPYNMQARAMSRLCTASTAYFHAKMQTVEEMETNLADGLSKLDFVGITEFYTASMCIYQHLSGLPFFDDCYEGRNSSKSHRSVAAHTAPIRRRLQAHVDHHVQPHPHSDVSPEVWAQVDALTKYDWRQYWLAMRRFACEVTFFEKETKLSLTHLLAPGGAEWLFDLSERVVAAWQHPNNHNNKL